MSDPDLLSRRMLNGLRQRPPAEDDTAGTIEYLNGPAADAAAEVGWLVSEVRGLHGRVNLLIGLMISGGVLIVGILVQIAIRLGTIIAAAAE